MIQKRDGKSIIFYDLGTSEILFIPQSGQSSSVIYQKLKITLKVHKEDGK